MPVLAYKSLTINEKINYCHAGRLIVRRKKG